MANRLLLSSLLSLFFFQLCFSIFYSSKIIDYNNQYKQLKTKYQLVHQQNQQLELKYIEKFALPHGQ